MTSFLGRQPPPSTTTEHPATALRCSAKRCREPAVCTLHWNNPKVHSPDRRKTWLACEQHRHSLGEFLDRRGFLRATTAINETPTPD